MTAEKYLSQISALDRLIENSCDRIKELKEIATSITVSTEGERVQSSGSGDLIGNSVARYVDLENEELGELLEKKKTIVKQIANLDDINHYDILYNLYVVKMSVTEYADRNLRSERQIWRLKHDALKAFEDKYLSNVSKCQ